MRRSLLLLVTTVALLTLSASAAASDASLRITLNVWSKKVGVDAHSVALAAQPRSSAHSRRRSYPFERAGR